MIEHLKKRTKIISKIIKGIPVSDPLTYLIDSSGQILTKLSELSTNIHETWSTIWAPAQALISDQELDQLRTKYFTPCTSPEIKTYLQALLMKPITTEEVKICIRSMNKQSAAPGPEILIFSQCLNMVATPLAQCLTHILLTKELPQDFTAVMVALIPSLL